MKNTNALTISNLASFAKLEQFMKARRESSTEESEMNFETFEVSLSVLAHDIENEIKANELARYDVEAPAIVVEGKLFRKCLDNFTAGGSLTISDGGSLGVPG